MASSTATSESIDYSTIDNLAKTQEYVPTPFAIKSINVGDDLPSTLLQVLSFQKMQNNTDDTDRHKLVLSDGTYMQLAILPSKFIVILSLEVKQSDCPFFGKPVYMFKEQQPEMMFEDRPSTSKRSLQFATELPSPQTTTSENISPIKSSHYLISKGSIKEANARYNKLNSHLEITLSNASILKHCTNEEQADQQGPPFTPINKLFHLTNNMLVDIIGLVLYVGDIIPIHKKDGNQTHKHVVKISDISNSTIDINLWGLMAKQKGLELKNMLSNDSVVIFSLRNARVGYFNGKLINITAATTLHINPTFLEAELLTLRGKDPLLVVPFVAETIHIDGKYSRMTIYSIHEWMSIKLETIQTNLLAILRFVNVTDQNFYYAACPLIVNGRPCKKKCTQQVDDSWFFSRCQMTMQDYNYSYLLPLKLQDATGTLWATVVDEGSIHLLQKTVKQLCALQNDATTTKTSCSVIKRLLSCHYSFTLLVSTETYNSESKMKVTVNKVAPVDFKAKCHALLPEIGRLSTQT
ncbi:replication protein A 70 kDa DNA-binding subunit E-like [Cryptomeria japonica]|uniref:replication protein A 70 kDa DNA-binding subunit E-like n=1 Tax=Cryptomeria japonica TaxID=3369 RepID=UPI0027DA745A|nr:replication protein A 70 kDa DNA-binding subunit E-like [Cryptomeria japonica]